MKQLELIGAFIDIGLDDLRVYVNYNKQALKWIINNILKLIKRWKLIN